MMHSQGRQLFPLFIFPPLAYVKALCDARNPLIDTGEHFIKQSYRNRYRISGPNGTETLTIPLVKGKNDKMPLKQVQISYADKWIQQHTGALKTAYANTPFYAYYGPEINAMLQASPLLLSDLSLQALQWCMEELGFASRCSQLSEIYAGAGEADTDYRRRFSGRDNEHSGITPYPQLFEARHGFTDNLSVLDLLFHEGRAARLRFL